MTARKTIELILQELKHIDSADLSQAEKNILNHILKFHQEGLITNVEVSRETVNNVIEYCEAQQVYDKLGNYGDFYYKLKKV